jgi:hypothetical protein
MTISASVESVSHPFAHTENLTPDSVQVMKNLPEFREKEPIGALNWRISTL